MAAYQERVERLQALLRFIPRQAPAENCPDAGTLLERAAAYFKDNASPSARRRAIQRDLEELVSGGEIEVVNPGGKPLRYRRAGELDSNDPFLWEYARRTMRQAIESALPLRRLERLWPQVLDGKAGFELGEDKLRIVSDTQRLLPADIREEVLVDVLEALARGRTLKTGYRDGLGTHTQPVLHPQGLLQRGPRLYLFALKNDETEPLRMYALHRMTRSAVGEADARKMPGFDLQSVIDRGQADFAGDEHFDLCLRARGYVADLLRDCPLSADQRIEDEPEDSDFEVQVRARVPATGQLLRWVLGCGDKVEVLDPDQLRQVVMAQTSKAAALYRAQDMAADT
jgi:proteasome accessory factor B